MSELDNIIYKDASTSKLYSPAQLHRFKCICDSVNKGDVSMNKAYNLAKDSFTNANGETEEGYQSTFDKWIQHAQDKGWIDKGLSVIDSWVDSKYPRQYDQEAQHALDEYNKEQERKRKTMKSLIIGGSIIGIIVIGVVVYNKVIKKD